MTTKEMQKDLLTQLGWGVDLIDAFLESDVGQSINNSLLDDPLNSVVVDLQNVVVDAGEPSISGRLLFA